MTTKLQTKVFGKKDVRVVPSTLDVQLGPEDVRIKMRAIGICGSDLHYYRDGSMADLHCTPTAPLGIGHEACGDIIEIGSTVNNLVVGDRVVAEPVQFCARCEYCLSGRYNICPDARLFQFEKTETQVQSVKKQLSEGFMCTEFVHPAHHCVKIPCNLSYTEGALAEPLAVGIHVVNRTDICIGSRVLIIGCGPIGMSCLAVAKVAGATHILATDIIQYRTDEAVRFGASGGFCCKDMSNDEFHKQVKQYFGPHGNPTIVLECSGDEVSVHRAVLCAAHGGCVGMIGLPAVDKYYTSIPLMDAFVKELDIKFCFRSSVGCIEDALNLVNYQGVNVKELATHEFPLVKAAEAFECADLAKEGTMKVLVTSE